MYSIGCLYLSGYSIASLHYILPITRCLNIRKVTPDFMDYMLAIFLYRLKARPMSVEVVVAHTFKLSYTLCRPELKGPIPALRRRLTMEQCRGNYTLDMHKSNPCFPTTDKVLCFKHYYFILLSLQIEHDLSQGDISWDCSRLVEFE